MRLRKIHAWALLPGAIALWCTVVGAQFADRKSYSGTNCVENSPNTTVVRYGLGFAFHTSATARTLLCPAVKDSANGLDSWRVVVDRNGATAAWSIRLIEASVAGDTGTISTVSVPAGNGVQAINAGAVAEFDNVGQLLVLSLSQPANARLHNYSLVETQDGDFF